ncbi:MAG: biopolymer transporter ExbD [Sulfurimonadaceae bacterium]|jgi:biopolymer transport protein ExbD|nr:biopolymer transporter ExbD [Sulfurimonadaceae bacterium]
MSYEDSEISEINMTPFVDIVLVILVIFMATATFVVEGKIPINLPQSSQTQKVSKPKEPTIITIDKDATYYLNDKPTSLDELSIALSKHNKEDSIVLRSDAKTNFEDVLKVIDICKKNSISKFSISTKER